jgi:hypothetical protein
VLFLLQKQKQNDLRCLLFRSLLFSLNLSLSLETDGKGGSHNGEVNGHLVQDHNDNFTLDCSGGATCVQRRLPVFLCRASLLGVGPSIASWHTCNAEPPTRRTIGPTFWHVASCGDVDHSGGVAHGGQSGASVGTNCSRFDVGSSFRSYWMDLVLLDGARNVGLAAAWFGVREHSRKWYSRLVHVGIRAVWGAGHGMLWLAFSAVSITWSYCVVLYNALTFSLYENLRLVWWAICNILALVCMPLVAVCDAAAARVTGTQTVLRGMVRDSGSVVAPVVPVACTELMVHLPATVEAAPVLETEAANAPVLSKIPAKQARTKSKVPKKGAIQTKRRRRIRLAPKSDIACPPLRRSERIAKRGGK